MGSIVTRFTCENVQEPSRDSRAVLPPIPSRSMRSSRKYDAIVVCLLITGAENAGGTATSRLPPTARPRVPQGARAGDRTPTRALQQQCATRRSAWCVCTDAMMALPANCAPLPMARPGVATWEGRGGCWRLAIEAERVAGCWLRRPWDGGLHSGRGGRGVVGCGGRKRPGYADAKPRSGGTGGVGVTALAGISTWPQRSTLLQGILGPETNFQF